jgi:hypothetical protein
MAVPSPRLKMGAFAPSHPNGTVYVEYRLKTDVRMLPQFGPLEGEAANKPEGRYETGFAQTPVLNFVEARWTLGCASPGPLRGT